MSAGKTDTPNSPPLVNLDAPTEGFSLAQLPERLGPCRLIRRLGSGGTAWVCLAEMVEDRPYAEAGSRVAVKILDQRRVGGMGTARFLREAALGQKVDHPAVVHIFDSGSEPCGSLTLFYLVMELLEGRSLAQLIRTLQIVPEALLRDIALQVAQALSAIHRLGIIHRDVKPSNILVTLDDQVKVMDLGIARDMAAEQDLTSAGFFIGTPLYASPEQLLGEPIGPPSDLYSLGVVLFEAATGRQLFAGGGIEAVIRRHTSVIPPRAGRFNSHLTPFLEAVIACLLEKDPAQRFASAAELADVLDLGEGSAWWREQEQVLGASLRQPARPIRVARETRVVGRDKEMAVLQELFREAQPGKGRVVFIQGEAGVGKTRLLDELITRVSESGLDCHVLYGSTPPGGLGRARGALSEALLSLFGAGGLEATLRHYLAATPHLAPAFVSFLTGDTPPRGSDFLLPESIDSVFRQLASALAAEKPVLWIADDLHLSDAHERGLFISLARMVHDQRLLLIGTSRQALAPDEGQRFERLEGASRLVLERLSAREVIHLLKEAFRSQALAEQLGGRIAAKSDGNPYFIFEMIREMKERDSIRQLPDGTYAAAERADPITVPSTVRDLLLGHIQDVSDEERALLDLGAVQGFAFDPDLIARVRDRRRLSVLESLAGIERRYGVIRATGAGFEFDHHQLQEALYEVLPPLLRIEYHALLAEASQARGDLAARPVEDLPGQTTVFLAEHYLKGVRTEGLRYIVHALDHLASLCHHEALLDLAQLALVLVDPRDHAMRCDIELRRCDCLGVLGQPILKRQAAEGAWTAAEQLGDPSRQARAKAHME